MTAVAALFRAMFCLTTVACLNVLNLFRQVGRIALIAFISAVTCSAAFSLDSDRTIAQFVHTAWGLKEGAPSGIEALAQTEDGYLWIGTANGLYRFDGVRFERYEPQSGPALPSRVVRSLLALPNGDLWIGFQFGAITLLRNGQSTNYAIGDGVPDGRVLGLAQDREGTIWAATSAGLARLEGNHWKEVGEDWSFPGKAAHSVFVDREGTLWVATEETLDILKPGSHRFQPTGIHIGYVAQIVEAANGRLWMAETSRSVRPIPMRSNEPPADNTEIKVGSGRILLDREGALWMSTLGDGLRRAPAPERLQGKIGEHSNAVEMFTAKDGLTDDSNRAILQDREGTIWVGTQNGLDEFRKTNIVPVPMRLNISQATLAAGEGGDLWISSLTAVIKVHDGKPYPFPANVSSTTAAYNAPRGAVWWVGVDVLSRMQNGHLSRFPLPEFSSGSLGMWTERMLTEDHSGTLWAAVEREGLFYLKNRAWQRFPTPTELEKLVPRAAFTDRAGHLWFGYVGGTILVVDGARIQRLLSNEDSPVGSIEAIRGGSRYIWVGGEKGLAIFDGRSFQPVRPADVATFERVSGIEEAHDGSLWLCESRGVIHIPAAEVQKRADNRAYGVQYEIFDSNDGLPGTFQDVGRISREVQGTDGRLWFVATNGIAWIDPMRIVRNTIPPPVSIQFVKADGRQYSSLANLVLPAQTANLQIAYTALSLSIPERVHFRYELEGLDNEWQDPGTRREAFYTKLGPGHYRFHVIACNNDGVWNDVGATLDFGVAPSWYQTIWFRALGICVFLLLLSMLYQLRLRQLERRFRLALEARVDERTRIARELHDTLLQSFQGVLLRFQAASNLLPGRPLEAKQKLDLAIEQTSEAIAEGRGAVQGLRTAAASGNDLAIAIRTVGEELADRETSSNAPELDVTVEGQTRSLRPIVRDELYRIAAEALRNAFRHAEARRIWVEIRYDAQQLQVRVRDDGKGIDADTLGNAGNTGHWGIRGMRERAKLLDGTLEIWSKVHEGTEVELTVPASSAYESRPSSHGSEVTGKEL